jgi:hypothetical protein
MTPLKTALLTKGAENAQTKRLYPDRASGCYCHYCTIDVYSDARTPTRQRIGQGCNLSAKSAPVGPCF